MTLSRRHLAILLLCTCAGCAKSADPEARVTSIRRSHVILQVTGTPGCEVEKISHSLGTLNEAGQAEIDLDVSGYSDLFDGVGSTTIDLTMTCTRYFVSTSHTGLSVELPLDTGSINRLPAAGAALYTSSASASSAAASGVAGTRSVNLGADATGRILLPIAAPGATSLEIGGTAADLDPVTGCATVAVDLTPYLLANASLIGEVAVPIRFNQADTSEQGELTVALNVDQATSILDRWLTHGAAGSMLPAAPSRAILWRRPAVVRGGGFSTIGEAVSVGGRFLATETTTRERIRRCGYVTYWGFDREVVLRDLVSGQEVARRTFTHPRHPSCPEVTFSNEPDQNFYASDATVRAWLEAKLEATAP